MIHADVATTIDRSQLKTRFLEASDAECSAYYEVAQWTYISLMKLHNLEHGKRWTWSHRGISMCLSNGSDVRKNSLARFESAGEDFMPVPGVCSVDGGGVALIWTIVV